MIYRGALAAVFYVIAIWPAGAEWQISQTKDRVTDVSALSAVLSSIQTDIPRYPMWSGVKGMLQITCSAGKAFAFIGLGKPSPSVRDEAKLTIRINDRPHFRATAWRVAAERDGLAVWGPKEVRPFLAMLEDGTTMLTRIDDPSLGSIDSSFRIEGAKAALLGIRKKCGL